MKLNGKLLFTKYVVVILGYLNHTLIVDFVFYKKIDIFKMNLIIKMYYRGHKKTNIEIYSNKINL